MQNRIVIGLLLGGILTLTSCSSNLPQPVVSVDQSLTIEAWRELPVPVKYESETLDILRVSNPKLKEDRVWQKFISDVIVPQRALDFPEDY